MGFGFKKSIKIAPGIKINLGKKSAGISIGGKAGGVSINSKRGVTARASVPGTGISYSTKIGSGKSTSKKRSSSTKSNHYSNAFLLEWQNAVVEGNQNKLICNENQLRQITMQQAENDLRIIQDCVQLTQSTLKPDVFFSRLDLLIERSEHLCTLEKYISFSGASPNDAYDQVIEQKQEAIKQFLIRYAADCFDKAETLKTAKGKLGRYQKFYDSLQPYYEIMDTDNIDYVETKYNAFLSITNKKD